MDETTPQSGIPAVLVQRVSKLASDRERSVTEQEAENRAECEREGWRVARKYSEQKSASRFARKDREEWKQLISDIRDGMYRVVVMWESSRGDRTPETWFRFLDACRSSGTLIHVTSHRHTYDMGRWREWYTLAEDGIDSAVEAEKTSDRSRRGIRANVAGGRPHGKVPYGYERVYDDRTRRLIEQRPHPEQAPVVREIKERTAAGVPVRTVMRDLNARGVPTLTGVPWSHQVVRQIALNPVYISRRLWRGEHGDGREHPAGWPPLVSEEIHYTAVAVLRYGTRLRRRPGRDRYLLSFLAVCAECGRPLQGRVANPGALPGYQCTRGCCSTRAPWLDAFITRLAIRKLSDPATHARLTSGGGEEQAAARQDAARLRARLAEASRSYAEGKIGIEALEGVEADLRPQLERAERHAAELAVAAPVRALLMTPAEDIAERWEAMEIAQRKAVVRVLFSRIALRAGKRGDPRGSRARFDPARVEWEWREGLR